MPFTDNSYCFLCFAPVISGLLSSWRRCEGLPETRRVGAVTVLKIPIPRFCILPASSASYDVSRLLPPPIMIP